MYTIFVHNGYSSLTRKHVLFANEWHVNTYIALQHWVMKTQCNSPVDVEEKHHTWQGQWQFCSFEVVCGSNNTWLQHWEICRSWTICPQLGCTGRITERVSADGSRIVLYILQFIRATMFAHVISLLADMTTRVHSTHITVRTWLGYDASISFCWISKAL